MKEGGAESDECYTQVTDGTAEREALAKRHSKAIEGEADEEEVGDGVDGFGDVARPTVFLFTPEKC